MLLFALVKIVGELYKESAFTGIAPLQFFCLIFSNRELNMPVFVSRKGTDRKTSWTIDLEETLKALEIYPYTDSEVEEFVGSYDCPKIVITSLMKVCIYAATTCFLVASLLFLGCIWYGISLLWGVGVLLLAWFTTLLLAYAEGRRKEPATELSVAGQVLALENYKHFADEGTLPVSVERDVRRIRRYCSDVRFTVSILWIRGRAVQKLLRVSDKQRSFIIYCWRGK